MNKKTIIKIIKDAKQSLLLKVFKRLIPTLIGLSVISSFMIAYPDQAQKLGSQALQKLGLLKIDLTTPELDLVTPLNQLRSNNNLNTLENNPQLDHIARLITISLADDPDQEELDLKSLSTAAGYNYSTIAYMATINPLPLIIEPTSRWLEDNKSDILDPEITEIGSHQLEQSNNNLRELISIVVLATPSSPQPPPSTTQTQTSSPQPDYYTGVELWNEIQKYRQEHGVPQLKQENTLCTIASIRVNQLIELGKLDNHDGFGPLVDQFKEDEKINYSNIGENILSGYPTAKEAVNAWDGSLGHQALMREGAYVWGCAAANHGFAVLIAAY